MWPRSGRFLGRVAMKLAAVGLCALVGAGVLALPATAAGAETVTTTDCVALQAHRLVTQEATLTTELQTAQTQFAQTCQT